MLNRLADPPAAADDVEAELAAALPQTQGRGFAPLLGGLAWHLAAALLLGAAAWILWREFRSISVGEIAAAVRGWGWAALAAAGLSALSFLLMGGVEWLGLRWAGAQLPAPVAMAGSFIASGIAHSLGSSLIVSGAVRARYYGRHGVTLRQVAAATLFQGLTFAAGISTLAGVCMVAARGHDMAAASRIANPVADGLGGLLLAGVAGYVALCTLLHRPLRAFGHSVRLPSPRMALAQVGLGAVDNAVAAAIIWVLLPAGAIDYLAFVTGYAPAVVLGLISHVPGGVGVFEGSLATLLKGLPRAGLAAAFLGYRLFFFLIPLLLAGAALTADTLRQAPRKKV